MRSRYTAYVLRDEAYLLATWHSSTRPARLELRSDETRWIGLDVREVERGGPSDTSGAVTFVARFALGRERHEMREVSTFAREEGRWVYLDGVVARGT
ncbi:SEC-C motif-containing protein [Deinococcus yavapaiensis KR-236]|uniref:SEC-C motif-containing protein n=2 Tax=Deinococcus TaxID=1298 RepID=A0A318S0T0_9DEIO|nr:SEC-C motif-containing protein [Deinococcus yavapaiensis KR-236]